MKKGTQKRNFSIFASGSKILSWLVRLSHFFYNKLPESLIGHLFSGDRPSSKPGLFSMAKEKIPFRRRVSLPIKRFFSRHFEQSFFLNRLATLTGRIPSLYLKCIGIFFFAFGLYTSVASLFLHFSVNLANASSPSFTVGILCLFFGAILAASSKTCSDAVFESRILCFFLFRLLGIPKKALTAKYPPSGRGNIAFVVGIAGGLLGSLFSAQAVLLFMLLGVLTYAILLLPECGVVVMLLSFPFLTTRQVAALTFLVTLSWLLKLLRGKRIFSTEVLDIAVIAFAVVIFFGGIVSVTPKESTEVALLMICLMAGYFVTVNLIRSSDWIKRCVGALTFALAASVIVGIGEYLLGHLSFPGLDDSLLGIIPKRAASLFGSSNALAELIILLLPFAIIGFRMTHHGDIKFGYSALVTLTILCLVFTWSRSGWLSVIFALVVLLFLSSREAIAKLSLLLLLVPMVLAVLPSGVLARLTSAFDTADSSLVYRFDIWQGADKLLSDNFAGGIGLGEAAFRKIYPLYSLNAIEGAPHTHNLYTQLTVSVGILGLFLFLALLLIFLRHCFHYLSGASVDEKHLRLTVIAGLSGIFGFLVMGLADYVFYNERIFLLFWLILGLTSAAIRTANRERIPQIIEGPCLEIDCPKAPISIRERSGNLL